MFQIFNIISEDTKKIELYTGTWSPRGNNLKITKRMNHPLKYSQNWTQKSDIKSRIKKISRKGEIFLFHCYWLCWMDFIFIFFSFCLSTNSFLNSDNRLSSSCISLLLLDRSLYFSSLALSFKAIRSLREVSFSKRFFNFLFSALCSSVPFLTSFPVQTLPEVSILLQAQPAQPCTWRASPVKDYCLR